MITEALKEEIREYKLEDLKELRDFFNIVIRERENEMEEKLGKIQRIGDKLTKNEIKYMAGFVKKKGVKTNGSS